jgi:hypothetical protein
MVLPEANSGSSYSIVVPIIPPPRSGNDRLCHNSNVARTSAIEAEPDVALSSRTGKRFTHCSRNMVADVI